MCEKRLILGLFHLVQSFIACPHNPDLAQYQSRILAHHAHRDHAPPVTSFLLSLEHIRLLAEFEPTRFTNKLSAEAQTRGSASPKPRGRYLLHLNILQVGLCDPGSGPIANISIFGPRLRLLARRRKGKRCSAAFVRRRVCSM